MFLPCENYKRQPVATIFNPCRVKRALKTQIHVEQFVPGLKAK